MCVCVGLGLQLHDRRPHTDTQTHTTTHNTHTRTHIKHTGRTLRETYDANQASAADCCTLCASMRGKGCTAWAYDPNGWFMDAAWKCT